MKESPCKGCERNGCGIYHDQCQAFQEWRKARDELNRKMYLDHDIRTLFADHERKYREKLRRKRRK